DGALGGGLVRQDALERDELGDALDAVGAGQEQLRHPSGPQRAQQRVAPEARGWVARRHPGDDATTRAVTGPMRRATHMSSYQVGAFGRVSVQSFAQSSDPGGGDELSSCRVDDDFGAVRARWARYATCNMTVVRRWQSHGDERRSSPW